MSEPPGKERRSIYATGLPNYSDNRAHKPSQPRTASSKSSKENESFIEQTVVKKLKTTHSSEHIMASSSSQPTEEARNLSPTWDEQMEIEETIIPNTPTNTKDKQITEEIEQTPIGKIRQNGIKNV